MKTYVIMSSMAIGAFFVFVAALGVLRLPDVYMRISAASKASTLGVSALLTGTALYFGDAPTLFRVGAILLFIALTVPVGGHMIGRAGYVSGSPLWKGSICDELRDRRRAALPERPEGGAPGADRS
jgi:multicomponent Na+:H+ antiporter subunit G